MGSPNEIGWLLNRCNIPSKSHPDFKRDPASPTACAFASFFTPQKFDFAQDDRLTGWFCKFHRSSRVFVLPPIDNRAKM